MRTVETGKPPSRKCGLRVKPRDWEARMTHGPVASYVSRRVSGEEDRNTRSDEVEQ